MRAFFVSNTVRFEPPGNEKGRSIGEAYPNTVATVAVVDGPLVACAQRFAVDRDGHGLAMAAPGVLLDPLGVVLRVLSLEVCVHILRGPGSRIKPSDESALARRMKKITNSRQLTAAAWSSTGQSLEWTASTQGDKSGHE